MDDRRTFKPGQRVRVIEIHDDHISLYKAYGIVVGNVFEVQEVCARPYMSNETPVCVTCYCATGELFWLPTPNVEHAFEVGDRARVVNLGDATICKFSNGDEFVVKSAGLVAGCGVLADDRDRIVMADLCDRVEVKVCTCDVWITGCRCGVFREEMECRAST